MKKLQFLGALIGSLTFHCANSQHLTVPNSTAGISNSTTLNIGIKTNKPLQNLHIFQDGSLFDEGATVEDLSAGIRLDYRSLKGFNYVYSTWDIRSRGGGLDFYDVEQKRSVLFLSENDNIGISTYNPRQKLHMTGNILLDKDNTSSHNILFAGASATSTGWGHWGIEYIFTPEEGAQKGLNFWKPFGSSNFGNYFLYLADAGNVGVGTGNPQAKLHVNGNTLIGDEGTNLPSGYRLYVQDGILTDRLKVAVRNSSDWADYVFDADYDLMPLDEVAEFIESNHHLPNVPSAEEIEEGGIDVAAMDSKLMEKIEELTLYLIELKKQNDELREIVSKLSE